MSQEIRNQYPCALCRHQRRRHNDNCEFGQYFPGDRSEDFERACRLFGFANLLRLMRSVEPSERQNAANSILREANIWDNDPIHGAFGHAFNLMSQIRSFERELENVNNMLEHIRDQQRQANPLVASSSPNIPQQGIQVGRSSTQIPNMGGADISARPSEKGESSTVAPKENETVAKERDSEVECKEGDIIPDKGTHVED